MKMQNHLLVAAAAFRVEAAAKNCMNFTVPVTIVARQGMFSVPNITSSTDVTTFFQNYTSIANGTNYTAQALLGYQNVQGTYNISAKFCTPGQVGSSPVVQVLSHGIGFDKTYWDLPYNNFNYSYIDVAVNQFNFCTLSIDRLGIGNSSHGNSEEAWNLIQAPAEVAALYEINNMLRMGTLPGVNHAFNTSKSIVNVGHSYGSQQTYMLSMMYPNITDGIVLTGFSLNSSFTPATVASFNSKIASQNQPLRFGNTDAMDAVGAVLSIASQYNITLSELYGLLNSYNLTVAGVTNLAQTSSLWDLIAGSAMPYPVPQNLPNSYLTWADETANQYNFLYPTGFDPMILPYAEVNKQPYTFGEMLTLGGAPAVSPFMGPVQIVTGQEDAIYCGGDCTNTGLSNVSSIPAAAAEYFHSSSNFSVNIVPTTGHALNWHYSSNTTNTGIQTFLKENGFVPM